MSHVVVDDHLLRDVLADRIPRALTRTLRTRNLATTNLYYHRLCRSATTGSGGALTGAWPRTERRALARLLMSLPDDIRVLPIRTISFTMAELAEDHGLSALGAEAVAAASILDAPLYVWDGDQEPRTRAAAIASGVRYVTVDRT